jgi:hypothetical protein
MRWRRRDGVMNAGARRVQRVTIAGIAGGIAGVVVLAGVHHDCGAVGIEEPQFRASHWEILIAFSLPQVLRDFRGGLH